MSSNKMWQICHKELSPNKILTAKVVAILKAHKLPPKQIALELDFQTERVRNWYYKNVGMTAHDIISLMNRYEFIKGAAGEEVKTEGEKNVDGKV